MVTEEFMGPTHPLEPNSALPSPLPASGCMSCGEDVNWDWNNKQSEPLGHLELTEKKGAAQGELI